MEEKKKEPASEAPEVIVYSTPACPYCTQAKEYLKSKGIAFTEYDVSKDKEKAKEMVMKSQQTAVPVLEINKRIVVGFNLPLIDDALQRKKPPKREDLIGNIIFDPFNI